MDNSSNNRKVEKAMKEALKDDRARIQVGRISSFGLMEMSRQRLRTGVLEASTRPCPHCEGTGFVRTASSSGLSALRMIEDEAARGRGSLLTLRASVEAAVYVLNRKRADIAEIEDRYGVQVEILPDGEQEGARMLVEASGPPPAYAPKFETLVEEEEDDIPEDIEDEEDEVEEVEAEARDEAPRGEKRDGEEGGSRRRRRRRGRRGKARPEGEEASQETGDEAVGEDELVESDAPNDLAVDKPEGESRRRRSRRGRRGGRRDEAPQAEGGEAADAEVIGADVADDGPTETPEFVGEAPAEMPVESEPAAPRGRRRPRARAAEETAAPAAPASPAVAVAEPEPVAEDAPKPKRSRRKSAATVETPAEEAPVEDVPAEAAKPKRRTSRKQPAARIEEPAAPVDEPSVFTSQEADVAVETPLEPPEAGNDTDGGEPRRGWWQRTFGA